MEFRTNENTAKSLTNLWSTRIFGFYHSTFLCVFWLQRARSPARNNGPVNEDASSHMGFLPAGPVDRYTYRPSGEIVHGGPYRSGYVP